MSSSISSENDVDNNVEDSDLDDETQSPSKFRENVKKFLDEQRKARAKAKALLEEATKQRRTLLLMVNIWIFLMEILRMMRSHLSLRKCQMIIFREGIRRKRKMKM